jgi:TetR/AcrR family transcriptional regulator, transcriptional repressor of aconitase
MQGMVRHFMHVSDGPDQEEESQRMRLMITSHLEDGEFARLLYAKIEKLIGPMFATSLDAAIASGDAVRVGSEPINLFWFAHHTVLTAALTRMPAVHCLSYGNAADLDRQLCEFLLRGIGLTEAAINAHLNRDVPSAAALPAIAESA